ncbi:glycosyltransferase family 4 protein [Candidatus Gracilibacteria bacterium]|nr:glycosyltransferase family 4 protein [Candidatus Gracilibacteria bacterium]
MRIGIDVRYLSHGLVGGVHTYIAHFVPALLEAARDHDVFLYADTKRPFEITRLPEHAQVRYLPYRAPFSSVANDLFMRRAIARDRVDVMHFPANYGFAPSSARSIITLHDAINVLPLREIWRGHPKAPRTVAMMTYLHVCSTLALKRADLVLTVSEHARHEIARVSGFSSEHIVAVPHAPTPDLRRVEDEDTLAALRTRFGISHPFVLADGLKNPAVLVRAWRRLPEVVRAQYRIVFFARRPDVLPEVHAAVAAGHATLLVRPERSELIGLYSMADAFVFPSWIEGFGIPLLEAMTCGAPVIASDRGAIPEVLGDAGLLAGAEDDASFARHLLAVLGDRNVAEGLRACGYARAAQFSWQHTAARILASYLTCFTRPRDGATLLATGR